MTQNEIIEMARQVGIKYRALSDEFATDNGDGVEIEQMQAFAKLVAAKEREACAKLCEDFKHPLVNLTIDGRARLAIAVRARAQADGGEA